MVKFSTTIEWLFLFTCFFKYSALWFDLFVFYSFVLFEIFFFDEKVNQSHTKLVTKVRYNSIESFFLLFVALCTLSLNVLHLSFIESNLSTKTNLGTQNLWELLTGGRCSEVALFYQI